MYVVDEISNEIVNYKECTVFIVGYIQDIIIFGYTKEITKLQRCLLYTPQNGYVLEYACQKYIEEFTVFSSLRGYYISIHSLSYIEILKETTTLNHGEFPYSFTRKYEAIENFPIFTDKEKVNSRKTFFGSKNIKYTIGLEFETSLGYIPEDVCFRDGLIPLRDGSIPGLEYSTIVLSGSKGLSLLSQQIDTLKKYTVFNKECSLHIHFGGFPLNPDKIFRLYRICRTLESSIRRITPLYTFESSQYKANKKDYCKQLQVYEDFDDMYMRLVGKSFYGDLCQPHPKDLQRKAKWHINTRYYWCNFINILCYNINKTIEFRFLRPTYNIQKILLWIYILNAILKYAEECTDYSCLGINSVVSKVYPPKLSNRIQKGLELLKILTNMQAENGDFIGSDMMLEQRVFNQRLF